MSSRRNLKVYLGGGIFGLQDAECRQWRRRAAKVLGAAGIETVDPMRRDYRGVELENMRDIVELDKADILGCDILLMNAARPSWGTAMEILYGWEQHRVVIVFNVDSARMSPWLRYHSVAEARDLKDALELVKAVAARVDEVEGQEVMKPGNRR